ncbi:MAG: 2-dehydropantoate 2-reductase [Candidatus Methanolliviera sp. GoM_asphalt]|nr:MAG: 2-dehydropantoate 2-reductase [Candidatus Methanolliviera sp. GoM_asphalt]
MVMGAGAIGSLIGGLMTNAGYNVALIGREWQVKKIRENGLHIYGLEDFCVYPEAYMEPIEADLIFITVKSYDTEVAARVLRMKEKSVVLSLQNGIGNEEKIGRIVGIKHVLGGVTSQGALLLGPGRVKHTGSGKTIIGELDGKITEKTKEIKEILDRSKIETKITTEIKRELWNKLIINVGINAITAITGLENGYICKMKNLRELSRKCVREVLKVAEKAGIDTNVKEESVLNVAKLTAKNRSSMLQDLDRGKKTEINEINGVVVDLGERYGVKCEVNETLLRLVEAMEAAKK